MGEEERDQLVCANGKIWKWVRGRSEWEEFVIRGIAWFGFETKLGILHGLWTWKGIHYFFKEHLLREDIRVNTLRIPLCVDYILADRKYDEEDMGKLGGDLFDTEMMRDSRARCTYLNALDRVIQVASEYHVKIVLGIHCIKPDGNIAEGLWYCKDRPRECVFEAWTVLATRYANALNVLGADLFNEAFDSQWTDSPVNGWVYFVRECAKRIHEIVSDWLIFVQGVNQLPSPDGKHHELFWGGSVEGMKHLPIELPSPNGSKLVLAPHVYGPTVHMQSHFKEPSFPSNMEKIWERDFGFAMGLEDVALCLGEWGSLLASDLEREWAQNFISYLKRLDCAGSMFWSFNPNSADTGGLLNDDWETVNTPRATLFKNGAKL
eukprot:Nk52_evm25s210 gene=Nk52_evmTU25s210